MNKEIEERSELVYIEKPDPWSSHSIIHNWMLCFPPGTKVLDIGTATGMLGRRCSETGFYLKGLEPVQAWAELAKPFYNEILCAALEQAPDEFISEQDLIVLGDVLEHTPNPEIILKRLVKLQKPETQYIISVPNVANIWIRINLLFGKFNYTDNGILDKTHLRFYTKSTFLKLLNDSELKPIDMKYTPIPLTRLSLFFQNNSVGRFLHRGLAILTRLLPELFAYQFVVRLITAVHEGEL